MTVTINSPALISGVRAALTATLNTEFATEGIVFQPTMINPDDTVSEACGACFFMSMQEDPAYVAQVQMRFGVQIYDATMTVDFDAMNQAYDPSLVEQWIERASVALKANEHAVGVWFLRVEQSAIDSDDAGNPTRAEIIVMAYTNNPYDRPNI